MKNDKKPIKENYGWIESSQFDGEPSGFCVEGGEEAFEEALEKWNKLHPNDPSN